MSTERTKLPGPPATTSLDTFVRVEFLVLCSMLCGEDTPKLTVAWRDGGVVSGYTDDIDDPDKRHIHLTIGRDAGVVRVVTAMVHELTHAQGHHGHRKPWREAYAANVNRLWGIDITDAVGVPHRYDLDLVVEYRLWRSRAASPLLCEVLGNPDIPLPIYEVAPLPRKLRLTARSAGVLAHLLSPFARWSTRVERLCAVLRTLPSEVTP